MLKRRLLLLVGTVAIATGCTGVFGATEAMIVYPRNRLLRPARELVVVESAVFGERDDSGEIPGTDPELARKNEPSIMMFNGRLSHEPLAVEPGDLVRAYVVNAGPGSGAMVEFRIGPPQEAGGE